MANHTYTKQVLQENGYRLFRGGKPILVKDKHYTFPELNSSYQAGSNFFQTGEIIEIGISELSIYGFGIVKKSTDAWGRYIEYEIQKITASTKPEKKVPAGHKIEMDIFNSRVRLTGNNAGSSIFATPWINLTEWDNTGRPENQTAYESLVSEMTSKMQQNTYLTIKPTMQKIEIPQTEIPMMVSYDHKIVCIPRLDVAPKIGMIGGTGGGNSFLRHRFLDQAYHKWNIKIACLNDKQNEAHAWSMPWTQGYSIPKLGDVSFNVMNEQTRPLPMVLLYQESSRLANLDFENDIGFRVTLPYKDIMENYETFFKNSLMDMGKTDSSFRSLIFDLYGHVKEDSPILNATSMKAIIDFFESIKVEGKGKAGTQYVYNGMSLPKLSVDKIIRLIQTIMSYRILDISTKYDPQSRTVVEGIPSQWELEFKQQKRETLNPIIACLQADLIPALPTGQIFKESWFPFFVRKHAWDIFENQKRNKNFSNAETIIDLEEWTNLIEGLTGEAKQIVESTFSTIWNEARPSRLGLTFRAQIYSQLLKTQQEQFGYYFCTYMNSTEAKAIVKDTGIKEEWIDVLRKVDKKKFEVIAIPNKDINYFVTYDMDGNRQMEEKPFYGRMLPPNSYHLPPRKAKEKNETDEDM